MAFFVVVARLYVMHLHVCIMYVSNCDITLLIKIMKSTLLDQENFRFVICKFSTNKSLAFVF